MSHNKQDRGPQDASRINIHEEYEVRYWTKALGVTEDKLEAVVKKVGTGADAARKELGKTSA
jgi:hypothetical protein